MILGIVKMEAVAIGRVWMRMTVHVLDHGVEQLVQVCVSKCEYFYKCVVPYTLINLALNICILHTFLKYSLYSLIVIYIWLILYCGLYLTIS